MNQTNSSSSYQKLEARFRQHRRLDEARSILAWDEAVVMPTGAGDARGACMGELSVVMQNLISDPAIGGWLEDVFSMSGVLNPMQIANTHEMRKIYLENTAVPADLNQKLVVARIKAEQNWRKLRGENNWKEFCPYLQEVLNLTRESLQILSKALNLPLYDTALTLYSKGLNTQVVEGMFNDMKSFLPEMIIKIVDKQKSEKVNWPQGSFPMAAQKALGLELMSAIGFNSDRGRLDESHHPFCGGTPHDVRITTRYSSDEFLTSLMGVLHETGHALYEQNLPREWVDQPVGQACGMSIHESQSLFWEMQIVRSREFVEFAAPLIRKHMSVYVTNPESLETENLVRIMSRVEPGLIRVDADEVTYPLHVILRFEIERDLIEDRWALSNLPEVWNRKMQEYLHLSTLGNDKDGCMQDVHWPSGAIGYFPAYTFGAVIAAQLFAKLTEARPHARSEIKKGEFGGIRDWLRDNIWSQGSRVDTLQLVSQAAGPLSATPFRRHLERRYFEA